MQIAEGLFSEKIEIRIRIKHIKIRVGDVGSNIVGRVIGNQGFLLGLRSPTDVVSDLEIIPQYKRYVCILIFVNHIILRYLYD